jgi:hypothetical protein
LLPGLLLVIIGVGMVLLGLFDAVIIRLHSHDGWPLPVARRAPSQLAKEQPLMKAEAKASF